MATIQYLEKFTNSSESLSVEFPLTQYEWQSSGGLYLPRFPLTGMDYAYDNLHFGRAKKDIARETVRGFINQSTVALAEAELQAMRATIWRIGRGKLWELMSDASRRWCWARAVSLPEFRIEWRRSQIGRLPVIVNFDRYSDWFASAKTTNTETVTSTGQSWTVNNPGDLPATLMVIRLRANAAAGITNPQLENTTNGYVFSTARDSASADSEIRLDTERNVCEYSNDDGGTYADDFANVTLPTDQIVLAFQLEPGDNTIQYTGGGTVNLDVEFSFYAPFLA